jgi:hypothetical protein
MDEDEHLPEDVAAESELQTEERLDICPATSEPGPRPLRRLSINEGLTLFVGACSLIVSFLTYLNAANTSDIKQAVKGLSTLAVQTKRQADETKRQADGVGRQLAFLSQQVDEAKAQTKAISEQTDAIKSSSIAAVKSAGAQIASAEAQKNMADVTARAQRPDVDLSELTVAAFTAEPDKNGYVNIMLTWMFRNTGGSALTVKSVKYNLYAGDKLPDAMPALNDFNGLDTVITPTITSVFAPAQVIRLGLKKEMRDGIENGSLSLFFYASFEYQDGLGVDHRKCFGRRIILESGSAISSFSVPAGGQAYHCNS